MREERHGLGQDWTHIENSSVLFIVFVTLGLGNE